MRWDVEPITSDDPNKTWRVAYNGETIYQGTQSECENIAAAHNAVIDMAFDSPGNVS